ncbi:ABC transporter permease [Halorarius halobius]|uniref:ABC transporter permease n=1 Tax=Halorarius halobius TaxID=2962671 RepID=UPI0020CDAEC6|nr:ABC transporter permease [Halorarius halobius]
MSRVSDDTEEVPLRQRIAENPRPALIWFAGFAVLFVLEAGAMFQFVGEVARALVSAIPGLSFDLSGFVAFAEQIPTLLSRDVIPNQGYDVNGVDRLIETQTGDTNYVFNGPWEGTFLDLSPKYAWLIRVVLIFAYSFAFAYWMLRGYFVFREHYRYADWTPRDDVVNRLRRHRWGQFGFVIVFMFLTLAIFAPALGPTTVEQNIRSPYEHQVTYFNEDVGEVQEISVGSANLAAASNGAGGQNTGPWQYDQYSRFHPFGTLPTPGKDLFTFMAAGSRTSLFIGLTAIGISGFFATAFGLLTAYYKGLVDLAVVVAGDSIMTIPQLLLLILVSVVFSNHWLSNIYNGGLLIALIFGFTGWPFLWRSVRGPAFQVSEQEWVDAARSYGQRASATMRKHMLPYIVGYLLIYGSMTIGGIIIGTSALSFLGLGVNAPTPEWGRAIDMGQGYVATQSWHISFIPGILIVLVVTAFNAMGDGIRDAIDPQSEGGEAGSEVAAAGGGGG